MTNKEISKLALKIFSIYVLVQALLLIPQHYFYYLSWSSNSYKYSSESWLAAISIISVISLVLISALIWKLSNKVTIQLNQQVTKQHSTISESSIISVLGLYLVFYGLFKLATTSIGTCFLIKIVNDINNKVIENITYLSVYFVVVILGASLIIKASGWLTVLKKLRTMGAK